MPISQMLPEGPCCAQPDLELALQVAIIVPGIRDREPCHASALHQGKLVLVRVFHVLFPCVEPWLFDWWYWWHNRCLPWEGYSSAEVTSRSYFWECPPTELPKICPWVVQARVEDKHIFDCEWNDGWVAGFLDPEIKVYVVSDNPSVYLKMYFLNCCIWSILSGTY